jgi:hypothetical protein
MPTQTIKTWIARHLSVRSRLESVCVSYLLFLMVATQKRSFTQAARFSGLHKSAFCKLLRDHFQVAAYTDRPVLSRDVLSHKIGPLHV